MFFKSVVSKNQSRQGDDIWISGCGDICVVIDAVSNSKNTKNTKNTIIKYLISNENELTLLDTGQIILKLNDYLLELNDELFASVGVFKKENKQLFFSSVGNTQLIKFKLDCSLQVIKPKNQPLSVLGLKEIIIKSNSFPIDDSALYMVATDGLSLSDIAYKDICDLKTNNELQNFAKMIQVESDWSFCLFPFERTLSYVDYEWPYFPFVGEQEEYEHEKEGLSKIANELFKDSDFYGFKIIGRPRVSFKNTQRKFDGVLISPFGIVLLELKDYYGDVELLVECGRDRIIARDGANKPHCETSPITKISEAIFSFTQWGIFDEICLNEKNIGAVIFTHERINLTLKNISGDTKDGNIIVSKVEDFPSALKKYWKVDITKGKKYRLSKDTIDKICSDYKNSPVVNSAHNGEILIKNGKYSFCETNKDENLSTQYYTLYKGIDTRKNSPVWIKEFELNAISKGSLDDEANRIKREIDALQELNKSHSIQDFKDEERVETKLYIVLEYIDGVTLQEFLSENKLLHVEKLKLLLDVALILKDLEDKSIVHRAINPKNIIIDSKNKPTLINFELCMLDFLPTLPPMGRRLFDSSYEAREVNSNASNDINCAADIYSFGQIISLVLRGELLFKNQNERVLLTKRDKNWHVKLSNECNLPPFASNQLRSILSNDPSSRPNSNELIEYISSWIGATNDRQ